ncbi:MAG: Gfo/Idh/MocA family oxidoreductase [Firmicutes bacterium]|nr:Gfo/Idh/MocA family oxidoreductase [Bacillota bacterium]
MIRTAMLSRWHVHANDYARQAQENQDISITAVWDEQPTRGQAWAEELKVPFYESLDALLSSDAIDAVIVDTPSNMHLDVITKAAQHGKHIYTEKVMGFTVKECEEMFSAIDRAGVQFMISLPRLTDPVYVYAQQALHDGLLGELQSIRCRLVHGGALPYEGHPHGWLPEHFFDPVACGGGALIDLGAHPIYLTNRLAGPAKALSAHFSYNLGHEVEDHAVVVVDYASGAVGILEAGFNAPASPFLVELHGTKGSLLIEDNALKIKSVDMGNEWVHPQLPAPLARPMEQWANAIVNGTAPTITRDDAIALTRINEAAKVAHQEGRRITL